MLNLPNTRDLGYNDSNWKVGDKVTLNGKNILFIWSNGTGKSTLLNLLNESLDRYNNILNSSLSYLEKKGFQEIFGCFENERDRWENYTEQELYYWCWVALNKIYKLGTLNIWNPNYKAKRAYCSKLINIKEWEYNKWLSGYVADIFMDAIDIYAQREEIDPEVIYWNLVMMVQWSHDQMEWDIQWGYIKPKGKQILVPNRVVYKLENKEKWKSGWEMVKKVLSEVKWKTLAFLEQPLNELDRSSKRDAREFLLNWLDKWTQVFMESHDDLFIDMAEDSDKWLVHDLGEKIIKE